MYTQNKSIQTIVTKLRAQGCILFMRNQSTGLSSNFIKEVIKINKKINDHLKCFTLFWNFLFYTLII